MAFLDNYETVEQRIDKFYQKHPDGRILTEIHSFDEKTAVVKALVYTGDTLVATGFAYEVSGTSPVNKTSYLENCESSAIGRALANYNFAKKGARPSREEMEKVQRMGDPALVSNQTVSVPRPATPVASTGDTDGIKLAKTVMAIVYDRIPDKLEANKALKLIPSMYGSEGNLYTLTPEQLRKIVSALKANDSTNVLGIIENTL
jgi:hypothetical protein